MNKSDIDKRTKEYCKNNPLPKNKCKCKEVKLISFMKLSNGNTAKEVECVKCKTRQLID